MMNDIRKAARMTFIGGAVMAILLCLVGLYVYTTFSSKNREKLEANDYKKVKKALLVKDADKDIKLSRVYECNERFA